MPSEKGQSKHSYSFCEHTIPQAQNTILKLYILYIIILFSRCYTLPRAIELKSSMALNTFSTQFPILLLFGSELGINHACVPLNNGTHYQELFQKTGSEKAQLSPPTTNLKVDHALLLLRTI